MQILKSIDDVITILGGPAAVGRLTDQPTSGVCNWRRGWKGDTPHFPPKYFQTIQAALGERGYSAAPFLFAFHGVTRKSA
jgi:hypothetical protein